MHGPGGPLVLQLVHLVQAGLEGRPRLSDSVLANLTKGVRFIKFPTELIGNEVHESAANFYV